MEHQVYLFLFQVQHRAVHGDGLHRWVCFVTQGGHRAVYRHAACREQFLRFSSGAEPRLRY